MGFAAAFRRASWVSWMINKPPRVFFMLMALSHLSHVHGQENPNLCSKYDEEYKELQSHCSPTIPESVDYNTTIVAESVARVCASGCHEQLIELYARYYDGCPNVGADPAVHDKEIRTTNAYICTTSSSVPPSSPRYLCFVEYASQTVEFFGRYNNLLHNHERSLVCTDCMLRRLQALVGELEDTVVPGDSRSRTALRLVYLEWVKYIEQGREVCPQWRDRLSSRRLLQVVDDPSNLVNGARPPGPLWRHLAWVTVCLLWL